MLPMLGFVWEARISLSLKGGMTLILSLPSMVVTSDATFGPQQTESGFLNFPRQNFN